MDYEFFVPLNEMMPYTKGAFSSELKAIAFDASYAWSFRAEETHNINSIEAAFIQDFIWIIQHEHTHAILECFKEFEANDMFDNLHELGLAF